MSAAFLKAVEVFRRAGPWEDEDEYDNAERVILKRKPHSAKEAAVILEVVAVNFDVGPRSDELDIKALKVVSEWLLAMPAQTAPKPRLSLAG